MCCEFDEVNGNIFIFFGGRSFSAVSELKDFLKHTVGQNVQEPRGVKSNLRRKQQLPEMLEYISDRSIIKLSNFLVPCFYIWELFPIFFLYLLKVSA